MKPLLHTSVAVGFVFLILVTGIVSSLECYECSSLNDQKCGEHWGFQGTEADKYKVVCESNRTAAACQKYIMRHIGSGIHQVYRRCWYRNWNETAADENFTPSGCKYFMGYKANQVCYCTDHTAPCNKDNRVVVAPWTVLVVLLSGFGLLVLH